MGEDANDIGDKIRLAENTIELANQEIIQFAYLTMEHLQPLIESNEKLFFEQANCYLGCYFAVKRMLESVPTEYRDIHRQVVQFYDRGISNDFDRLAWRDPPVTAIAFLKNLAKQEHTELPDDAAMLIAKNARTQVDLEGLFRRVAASACFTEQAISVELVSDCLGAIRKMYGADIIPFPKPPHGPTYPGAA